MKKRTFRDEEEAAADLERRASEKRSKAAYTKVVSILKKHPDANEKALTHLVNLGYTTDSAASAGPRSRQAASVQERAEQRRASEALAHPTLPLEFKTADPKDLVPTKIDTFEQLTAPMLTIHCLQAIEPAVLSSSNLRSMILNKKNNFDSTKGEFLRLLEFCTGVDKNTAIRDRQRVWRLLEEDLKQQSVWRGRRCKDVKLLVDWPVEGIYDPLVTSTGQVCIRVRATNRTKIVPESKAPPKDWALTGEMCVDYNWSETRAVLTFTGAAPQPPPFKIIELFPDGLDHILPVYKSDFEAAQNMSVASGSKALLDQGADRIPTPRKVGSNAQVLSGPSLDPPPERGEQVAPSSPPPPVPFVRPRAAAGSASREGAEPSASASQQVGDDDEKDDDDGDEGEIDETDTVPPEEDTT